MTPLHYIYAILAAGAIALGAAGCDDAPPSGPGTPPATDRITLSVSVPLADATRSPSDPLNEYTVSRLHLYFYTKAGHDDLTSLPAYHTVADGEFQYTRSISLPLPDDAMQSGGLLGDGADGCYIYAIANAEPPADGEALTVSRLKATTVDSRFDRTETQPAFAMDGFAELTYDPATRTLGGSLPLQRAAARITLSLDLPDSIQTEHQTIDPTDGTAHTGTRTYRPRAEEMRVWISNGVKRSPLNTAPAPAADDCLYSNRISAAAGEGSAFTPDPAREEYRYVQEIPFYSYPASWDPYSPHGNCHLTLSIPWSYTGDDGATRTTVTYYRLSVQPGKCAIERNTLYDMRVAISRLGSTDVQQPVEMTIDWTYNMQWNIQTLPTDIKEIRYLLLNNNDYSAALAAYAYRMDNETEISIPYNTSHPVEIEEVKMEWYDYRNDTSRSLTLTPSGAYRYGSATGYAPATDFAGIELDAATSTLRLRRDMLHVAWSGNAPSISGSTAINAYTFRIRLRHSDAPEGDPSSHATVSVTQIPAICITAQLTSDGTTRFINSNNTSYSVQTGGSWYNPVYTNKGYVTTSNSWPTGEKQQRYWLGSYHSEATYVNNKNTYILTISKFADGDDYVIADPRTRSADNLNESGTAATATADWSIAASGRQLQHYYPADRSDARLRFIAPQLRVASQWGVTYQISRTAAERRCASYQENGRPAGRWRLPTAAEIEYISGLSNRQYIPYLFGSEGGNASYWCASGGIDVYNDASNPRVEIVETTASERRAVRCVYDEWFWGTDTLTNKTTFTWGDRPRSTSGN